MMKEQLIEDLKMALLFNMAVCFWIALIHFIIT